MAKHRSHGVAFKRQIAQEFLGGETLRGPANRHDLSRNLIRIWVEKYEAGVFDEDAAAADLVQGYEARIAALERLVGKQALELEFLKEFSRTLKMVTGWTRYQGNSLSESAKAHRCTEIERAARSHGFVR